MGAEGVARGGAATSMHRPPLSLFHLTDLTCKVKQTWRRHLSPVTTTQPSDTFAQMIENLHRHFSIVCLCVCDNMYDHICIYVWGVFYMHSVVIVCDYESVKYLILYNVR